MKSFSIAGIEIKNRYVLAPLAGYTDFSMRKMCSDYGAGLVYTEMESCEAICYNSQATIRDILDTKLDKEQCQESKLALQIFGGKEESILKSIEIFEKYGAYDFLDFNCGCPVPKVLRQGAGSAWLKTPDRLIDLMEKIVEKSTKPVIIKMRLGFDTFLDMPKLCQELENIGVQAIAIHGRIQKEYFAGPVHYDLIHQVVDKVKIPIIANGFINENNFQNVFEESGAQAVMIGQRALGYPKVFSDMIRKEEGKQPIENSIDIQINDLIKHLNLIYQIKDEKRASDIMRSISTRYVKGALNATEMRHQLVQCKSKEEYLSVLQKIK